MPEVHHHSRTILLFQQNPYHLRVRLLSLAQSRIVVRPRRAASLPVVVNLFTASSYLQSMNHTRLFMSHPGLEPTTFYILVVEALKKQAEMPIPVRTLNNAIVLALQGMKRPTKDEVLLDLGAVDHVDLDGILGGMISTLDIRAP